MEVDFQTVADTDKEYKIMVKISHNGVDYRQDALTCMEDIGSANIQIVKDINISYLIGEVIKNILRHSNDL